MIHECYFINDSIALTFCYNEITFLCFLKCTCFNASTYFHYSSNFGLNSRSWSIKSYHLEASLLIILSSLDFHSNVMSPCFIISWWCLAAFSFASSALIASSTACICPPANSMSSCYFMICTLVATYSIAVCLALMSTNHAIGEHMLTVTNDLADHSSVFIPCFEWFLFQLIYKSL